MGRRLAGAWTGRRAPLRHPQRDRERDALTAALVAEHLPRAFFARPGVEVAPDILGMLLVHRSAEGVTAGAIVEVEAYGGPDDLASHARAGLTRRTAPMFGPPGHAYVYLIYGMHECFNVVTETEGQAGALLVRALAPVEGLDLMRHRRGRPTDPDARLAAGPARLCQAMGIDRSFDGWDLTGGGPLVLSHPGGARLGAIRRSGVTSGHRIGVRYAGTDWAARPWRFGLRGHPSLSQPFRDAV